MLHMHKKLGWYMQFGGHIELHESPWQAIIHELQEESGYDMSQLQILQPHNRIQKLTDAVIHPTSVIHSTHEVGTRHFHTDSGYAFITSQSPQHAPHEGESLDLRLFTRAELAALPSSKIVENIREICFYIFDECLPHWQAVSPNAFVH